MSTDRQKSFVGTLSCEGAPVCTERVFSAGRGGYKLLVINPDKDPTRFYFRYEHEAYILYVRGRPGVIQLVNLNPHGELAISPPSDAHETRFDIGGMSLEDMHSDSITSSIAVKGQRPLTLDIKYGGGRYANGEREKKIYFKSENNKPTARFTVNIIERNAGHVEYPDEV
ncbi:hypothetical protein [Pseudomonas sp. NPDC087804]|jgi:hypothetical protein|uniref:hypothetical protein n=1 Tax=Pseudomonas sp. NPDC087804 TaxID=3364449 RepID=UPI003818021B